MHEDEFVRMLLQVAGGEVLDERDVDLARAAARWATQHGGWTLHLENGYFFEVETMTLWILVNRIEQKLEIRFRLAPGQGWHVHAQHRIAHVGHALDVLVVEDLLPARFSTIGRRALQTFGEVLDRGAEALSVMAGRVGPAEVAEYGRDYAWELSIRAAVMNRAADQARAFPCGELAVAR